METWCDWKKKIKTTTAMGQRIVKRLNEGALKLISLNNWYVCRTTFVLEAKNYFRKIPKPQQQNSTHVRENGELIARLTIQLILSFSCKKLKGLKVSA